MPQDVLDKISSDLAELMASKPDWAQIEEALAGKGDLEKVIAKADADYVEDLFKSLNANMESQLYDLRKSAEAGVSGAAEELESLSYKWANLQAALGAAAGGLVVGVVVLFELNFDIRLVSAV